jgi:hypothetical protein
VQSILFYVSGHGFGHARRMTQVMRALRAIAPDVAIHVRTAAPPRVFEPIAPRQIQSSQIDSGMVEADTLSIDRPATLEHLERFIADSDSIVRSEIDAVLALRPSMIVADVPFLAGDVSAALGVPCIGISNFTWEWIYQSFFGNEPRYRPIHEGIVQSYSHFNAILQLPFGQTCPQIQQTIPMPLIAPRSTRSKLEILSQLGMDPNDRRPRALFATRGGISPQALATAAMQCPQMLFLSSIELREVGPSNLKSFHLSAGLDFSDVLSACDVVVSKLGYGIVAECIAARVRLLWPRRNGFAEDDITECELPKYVPTMEISHEDYASGNWGSALQGLIALPLPNETMRTDGAEQCVKWIVRSL